MTLQPMQMNKQTLMTNVVRAGAILLAMGWGATAALAAAGAEPPAQDYDTCVALVESNAEAALTYARNWEDAVGPKALAARHCEALALTALGRHHDAAIVMSEVALAMESANAPASDRAAAFAQVADAWSLAKDETRARVAIDQALALDPNADYLMQRANIRALAKDWDGVRLDTGEVLAELPTAADALALRASAYRNLGVLAAALEDADRALEIAPHNLSALLERGRVKAAQHDMAGARADWKSVIDFAGQMHRADDPRAAAAKIYLNAGAGVK